MKNLRILFALLLTGCSTTTTTQTTGGLDVWQVILLSVIVVAGLIASLYFIYK